MSDPQQQQLRPEQQQLMYLPKDFWSPRYNETFYTVAIDSFRIVKNEADIADMHDIPVEIAKGSGSRKNLPAYYYELKIFRQHKLSIVFRRYSHFRWLIGQLEANPPPPPAQQPPQPSPPIRLPITSSGTTSGSNNNIKIIDDDTTNNNGNQKCSLLFPCLPPLLQPPSFWQSKEFAETRREQLAVFINDLLSRGPEYSSHPAVVQFLEL